MSVQVEPVGEETEVGPYAKIIADSVSPEGHRLTTMEVRFHRFVLAEFNTHRVFSRNSASSRAIPFRKQVERIESAPAVPLAWPREQKGMQGGDEIEHTQALMAEDAWLDAKHVAVSEAKYIADLGVHKSVVNRLLEPFMWHTVVVTATEWEGFFAQRCSPLAQPEIRVAAEMMREAYLASEPTLIQTGDWHLPYITEEDIQEVLSDPGRDMPVFATLARVSAARCARVSYLTHDGKRSLDADLALYDRLVSADPWHASPLEHPATPWAANVHSALANFVDVTGEWQMSRPTLPRFGNFLGWRQLRFEIEAAQAPYQFASPDEES